MSEVTIKRANIRKTLRKNEIDQYMKKVRQQMLIVHQQTIQLTKQTIENYKCIILKSDYRKEVVIDFINHLGKFQPVSLANPNLLGLLKKSLQSLLDIQNYKFQGQKVFQLLLRMIKSCNSFEENPLQMCFYQLEGIASLPQLQLDGLWPHLALNRSESIFKYLFESFINYANSRSQHSDTLIQIILESILNFVNTSNPNLYFSFLQISKILQLMIVIMKQNDLGDSDLTLISKTLYIIINKNSFSEIVRVLIDFKIFPQLVVYLSSSMRKQLQYKTTFQILKVVILVSSGSGCIVKDFLRQNSDILQYCDDMVNFTTFACQEKNMYEIQSSLTVLCNIAGCESVKTDLIRSPITKKILKACHQIPSSSIKVDLAIFLHNLVEVSDAPTVEILCTEGLISSLDRLIREEYEQQCKLMGIRCLTTAFKKSKQYSVRKKEFIFSQSVRLKSQVEKFMLFNYLDSLLVSRVNSLVKQAAQVFLNQFDNSFKMI